MNDNDHQEPKLTWAVLKAGWTLITPYWKGDMKKQAWRLLMILILMIILMSGINAFKTYISKWAINALTNKNKKEFYNVIFLAVISLGISAPIVALKLYYQNKLSLFWRKWFNLNILKRYFDHAAYYKMSLYSDVDNPDQRIAEDLNNFVQQSANFFSIFLLSIISILTYIGVLGSISLYLVASVIVYATIGTVIIVWLSRKLVLLNFRNIRYQANYRYNLVHVRDNIESIAFYQGETHESSVLKQCFYKLIDNFFSLIKLQRNISYASETYTLFAALIPFLILAPSMFRGQIEVGTVVQASTVFMILLSDLSIIVSQFEQLSTLAATTQRLSGFSEGLSVKGPDSEKLSYKSGETFYFDEVTVFTPDLKKTLVKNLTLDIKPGTGLMIVGPSGCGKSSLLRSIAGLWQNGHGQVTAPNRDDIMFLPQKPYMLIGTLREQLVYPNLDANIDDDTLQRALETVGLNDLVDRVGGLDVIMNWADLLSIGEQQRVIFLRLILTKPKFAILDESTSALDETNEKLIYQRLRESGITFISVGHRSSLIAYHDYILKLDVEHGWQLMTQEEYSCFLSK